MAEASQQGRRIVAGQEQEEDLPQTGAREQDQAAESDLDAVLDDIETTLETNAKEYVQGFVQKGGQ
ncbi:ubiquitin-like protein Pup [Bifidobacterium sp. W8109]|uniref:ubiquitin-like protein Pup n=1 Tax=Bifidobacterium TaxID=1678 RepID=UPI0018DE4BDC|nr:MULTISPECIES: ubiquitin-like protein Pup [Bifidobacterium]MBH9970786.1 ubiquitin-like protein Pup [Bifidobacterium asteroides]MBI0072891.1 ubiquitin-like protein Pup [Bifidobacterium sp. W8110]